MRLLQNRSLRQKIILASVTAALVILLLTMSGFVITQGLSAEDNLIESKSAIVEVLASSSTAAAVFDDAEASSEILSIWVMTPRSSRPPCITRQGDPWPAIPALGRRTGRARNLSGSWKGAATGPPMIHCS